MKPLKSMLRSIMNIIPCEDGQRSAVAKATAKPRANDAISGGWLLQEQQDIENVALFLKILNSLPLLILWFCSFCDFMGYLVFWL
ncbi:MAG: hypothetical protein IMF02_11285 [Proteobacteria bacterium]|nr:hypothetical protein [Pseudomonadota bacterium]